MERENEFGFFTIDQPAGRYYISKISADVIIPLSQSDTRSPYNSTGIQRKLNKERVREIAKYCELGNAMFPTPIILSADSQYFTFRGKNREPLDFADIESGFLEIDIEKMKEDEKFLSIVDGQHRLAGIDESGMAECFDLLVMFVFDTQAYEDAEIFSIINRNQKQVSKSLVYDLYGLTSDMTVEKFSHEIVKALNTVNYSKLRNRIKMLGYKSDNFNEKNKEVKQYVSQAALVDELILMISKDIVTDNKYVKEGRAIENPMGDKRLILRTHFYDDNLYLIQAELIGFYNVWLEQLKKFFSEDTIMYKTIGFIASLEVFRYLYNETKDKDISKKRIENDSEEEDENKANMNDTGAYIDKDLIHKFEMKYRNLMRELNFKAIKIDRISSSKSGAKRIFEILISGKREKEYKDYFTQVEGLITDDAEASYKKYMDLIKNKNLQDAKEITLRDGTAVKYYQISEDQEGIIASADGKTLGYSLALGNKEALLAFLKVLKLEEASELKKLLADPQVGKDSFVLIQNDKVGVAIRTFGDKESKNLRFNIRVKRDLEFYQKSVKEYKEKEKD